MDLFLNFNCTSLGFSRFMLDYCLSLPAPLLHTEQRWLWAKLHNFSHLISLRVDELAVMTASSKVNIAIEEWARLSRMHVFIDWSWGQAQSVFSHFLSRSFMQTSWVETVGVKSNIPIQGSKATAEGVLPAFAALALRAEWGWLIFQEFSGYFKIILVNPFFPWRKKSLFFHGGFFRV